MSDPYVAPGRIAGEAGARDVLGGAAGAVVNPCRSSATPISSLGAVIRSNLSGQERSDRGIVQLSEPTRAEWLQSF